MEDCECRSGDASACAAQCSEAGADGSADVVECTDQDLSKCEPPPSQCIDANTLRYFDNASCVDGHCAWEQKSTACACSGGGCQFTNTAGGTWSDSG
jgi:hypothetical protein